MEVAPSKLAADCPAEEISAYIDGELSPDREIELESHFAVCESCRNLLNEQKGFLIALTGTLEREAQLELPENFTRSIVVNAESKVSGLRDRRELSWAVVVGGGLFLLAAIAVGSFTGVLSPVAATLQKLAAVTIAAVSVAGDLFYAVFAVVRSLFQSQTFGPGAAYIIVAVTAAMLLYLGSRSIRRYFRTPGT